VIETDRLILRRWREADRAPFAALNADPEVMRYFPAALTRAESDAAIDRMETAFNEKGISFWAAEHKADGRFVGLIGLQYVRDTLPIAPALEVGWRLTRDTWGQGLAPEGARAALAYAFAALKAPEVLAYTAATNAPSRRVMEKLGMTYDPASDFLHPKLAAGHPLQQHVVYRLKAA